MADYEDQISRVEAILRATLGQDVEVPEPLSRVEELLIELKEAIEEGGGGGGDITQILARLVQCERDIDALELADTGLANAIQALTNSLGSLATKNNASATYTPQGSVSQPTFTGSQSSVTLSIEETDNFSNYQPKGSVSQPTFTGSSSNVTVTTEDNINGNYTPKGTVSQPTFTGSSMTSTGSYTPAGSVSEVELNTTTFKPMISRGTLPSLTANVSDETLSFSWSAGTLPGIGSDTTCATTVKTQPSFSGTAVTLSVSGTPTGTVSQPSFTGTKAQISGTVTPAGTVSQPTFSGTKVKFTGTNTATGTVSQPTFSGTEATITVS